MNIYDAIARILAEALTLGNALMSYWVSIPANATGPLDPNATLTQAGNSLAAYIASSTVHWSDMICVTVESLF